MEETTCLYLRVLITPSGMHPKGWREPEDSVWPVSWSAAIARNDHGAGEETGQTLLRHPVPLPGQPILRTAATGVAPRQKRG